MTSNDVITPEVQTPHRAHLLTPILGIAVVVLSLLSVGLLYMLMNKKTNVPVKTDTQTITLPANAVKISGCIAHEGEHWVEPANLPSGPFYITYNDKVVAIEWMFKNEDIPGHEFAHMDPVQAQTYLIENQLTLSGLINQIQKPNQLPKNIQIKDWTMHWTPPHAGFVEPHYDMHFWLVDSFERASICPSAKFEDVLPPELYNDLQQRGIPVPEIPGT